jgi:group II intron reverse transcriptase/maturase
MEAWKRVARNGGSAGVDRLSVQAVKDYGEEKFIEEIRETLAQGTYRPEPVRRVHIPKAGRPGETRPLGIPTVRDRVVQMAVKMLIEPLMEADFQPCSYGFRPQRTVRMALNELIEGLKRGQRKVVDVDLKSYFDTIDHELLMELVERRIVDQKILRLLRGWLQAGILEEGAVTHPFRGTPQGGVISPLLANLYLNEVDGWWKREMSERIVLIRYADDMVLLAWTEEEAAQAWLALQATFAELRLTVNQEKSRLTDLERGFAFLGFEFRAKRDRIYLWPRAKAVNHSASRIRETVREIPSHEPLETVIRKLNPVLNGWCTYYRVGHSNRVFHKVDWIARQQVQLWLRYKHQVDWRTAQKRWNYQVLHEEAHLYRMVGKVSHLEALR